MSRRGISGVKKKRKKLPIRKKKRSSSFILSKRNDDLIVMQKAWFESRQSFTSLSIAVRTSTEADTKRSSQVTSAGYTSGHHVRAVDSGGEGSSCPPGPVKPDKWSLWMDLFSLDSVILTVMTCNCLPFSYSRSIFRETKLMTSAENSVSAPQNLKIFWGRIPADPATRLLLLALSIMPPPPPNPITKKN